MKRNRTFVIAFDGLESYWIVERRELIIKSLIELKYTLVMILLIVLGKKIFTTPAN